jgi:peptidyl-tRNA hydrolase
MSKQSKSGSGNMLLLAGLGVGAFMLFASKSGAQSRPADIPATESDSGNEADIPAAPRILAVSSSASESPLPTGIVSDEEGMEVTAPAAPQSRPASNTIPNPESPDSDDGNSTGGSSIPPLISTTLTPKEKAIIDGGQLTYDLAIRRPDLYKAIYVRKHGKNGHGQRALQAADALIQSIRVKAAPKATLAQKRKRKVKMTLNPNAASMVIAAAQAAGGSSMAAMVTTAAGRMQHKAGVKAPMRKAPARHPAVRHPAKKHRSTSALHRAIPHR